MSFDPVDVRNDQALDSSAFCGRIAELERALEESERRNTELQASATRYRNLVEHGLGLICTHDLDGRLLSINAAAAHLLEYEPEELTGQVIAEILAPDFRDQFWSYLHRMKNNGADHGLMRLRTRSGSDRVWAYRNVVIDPPGGAPHVLGHAQDITALIRTRQELRLARDELESRVRERTSQLTVTNGMLQDEVRQRVEAQETLRRAKARLELLNAVALGATASSTVREMLQQTVERCSRHFTDAQVVFLEPDGNSLRPRHVAATQDAPYHIDNDRRLQWPTPMVATLKAGDRIAVADTSHNPQFSAAGPDGESHPVALLAFPVRSRGELAGILCFRAAPQRAWAACEFDTIREIAGFLSLALRNL